MCCKRSNLLILVLRLLFVRTVKNYYPCERLKLYSNTFSTLVLRTKFFIRLNGPLETSMYVLKRSPKMKKPGYNDSCWIVLSFLWLLFPRWIVSIKLRANGRNSFQWPTTPTMLGITCCVVACFSELLHEVWNWSNWTWAKNSQHFFCCVIRIMLDPLALLFQNCWGHTSASCLCILLSVSSALAWCCWINPSLFVS